MALPGPIPSRASFATEFTTEFKDDEPRLRPTQAEAGVPRRRVLDRFAVPEHRNVPNRFPASRISASAARDDAGFPERFGDPLPPARTQLPDRTALLLRLQQCTDDALSRHRLLAMIFVEVVGFPVLSASTPGSGRAMLTAVATRHSFCTHAASEPDPCCIRGIVMAQPGTGDTVLARTIATRARAGLDGRYWLDSTAMEISVSIGLVLLVEPAVNLTQRQPPSTAQSGVR